MGLFARSFISVVAFQLLVVASVANAAGKAHSKPQAAAAEEAPTPAPSETPAAPKHDYTIAPSSSRVIEQDSSAFHRIDKTYQVTAILFGVGPSLSGTYGLQGSYFLNRNQLVLVELTGGTLSYNSGASISGSQSGSSGSFKTQSLGVHYKQFAGNSFYFRTGLDFRKGELEYTYSSGGTTDYYRFKGTSIAANFQIGNQWQWSNFTLGCDWIGISVPLSSTISDEQLSPTAPSYYSGWQKSDEDTFIKNANLNLLRFYLGASF